MKLKTLAFALLPILSAPAAVHAQAAPAASQPSASWVGLAVVDPKEQPVGTVSSIKDGNVVVKTDKHEIAIPAASFANQNGKLYFAMGRDQLNAEYEKSLAAAEAALVAGAEVKGSAGTKIGTIEAIDAEFATIKLNSGKSIRIPRNGIAGTPGGAVIGMTAEALEAMVSAK